MCAPPKKAKTERKAAWTRPPAKESEAPPEASQDTSWLSRSFSRMFSSRIPDNIAAPAGESRSDESNGEMGSRAHRTKNEDSPMTSLKGIHIVKLKHNLSDKDMEVTEV